MKIGERAVVTGLGCSGALRRRIIDMGITPGAVVILRKAAPMGDPLEINVRGYELSIRRSEAKEITVETEGGGVGPMKRTVALAGNPNCGKTTLFNELTGSNQYVGNWPGVTVEKKSGQLKGHPDVSVVDLPGIYSLSPYSAEELVTRNFVLEGNPDVILDVVDATNIERNLYLTLQLAELGRPMVVALNMMDMLKSRGVSIDVQKLEHLLGLPVVPISASRGKGIRELIERAVQAADRQGERTRSF